MAIERAYAGEDVPVQIAYTDDAGNAVDPDDQGSDGVPDADITIVDTRDETEVVSAAAMTHVATGEFEYVWDSSTANGPATYRVEISAEFSAETKITKDVIDLE